MRTLSTTMLFLLLAVAGAFAQNNNIVVFSENGERFTLILNGIRQNAKPETNVKVTGLNAPNYKAKIIFESKSIFDLDQSIYLQYGGESTGSNMEYTYSIVNKKGKYKLRPVSASAINVTAPPAANQTVVVYTTTDAVLPVATTTTTVGTGTTNSGTVTTNVGGQTTGGTVTTTTTTTGTGTTTGENVSFGMNVNGMGVNMNVNINDGTGVTGTNATTTTTSTTYSSTVTTSGTGTTTTASPTTTATTTSGCVNGMNASEFTSAKSSITSKSFEDSKMTMAKQVIKNNCLTTSQVKEIMQLFSFEETKLDLAKYAYNRTVDPNNYYKLNDAFTFETTIEELDKYIESQKK